MRLIVWVLAAILVAVYMLGPVFGWTTNRDWLLYAVWIVLIFAVFGILRDRMGKTRP